MKKENDVSNSCIFLQSGATIVTLTLKEPGFLDPSHSQGADSAPLRSRKPIDETSSVWY